MTDYTGFARFYDRIMGDRTEEIGRLQAYISRHLPGARSLLELGCGTGALLAGLSPRLSVTGIDGSPDMLAVAEQTAPAARLVLGDMTAFSLPDRFDVIICMFDTLNHVQSFAGWLTVFSCVHEHLADGGLFIFDVNTAGRLHRLDGAPPYLDEFDGNVVVMTVRSAAEGLSLWQTRIFERRHDDIYRLHDERIYELGVPLMHIRAALAGRFELLEEASLDGSPVSDESDRVFFVYRHRSAGIHAVG
ncbi:MAG TPA: class I SAM-dependent methyltransferase [Streptosporangiaceae bacterium]|nr:class I SAM-dependent methyltransferase [Streptosporangiaceae bacterium]